MNLILPDRTQCQHIYKKLFFYKYFKKAKLKISLCWKKVAKKLSQQIFVKALDFFYIPLPKPIIL